jgi:hypothetical protein
MMMMSADSLNNPTDIVLLPDSLTCVVHIVMCYLLQYMIISGDNPRNAHFRAPLFSSRPAFRKNDFVF